MATKKTTFVSPLNLVKNSTSSKRTSNTSSAKTSKTTSSKTNFVSPTSLVKNSASNKTSTKTSSKSTTKVNSSPVRSKSRGTTSYFQPKTSAKSKTTSGRKTTSYTPWYRRDRLDMSNRKSSKDRLGGSSAYAGDYLARLLSGMSEKDWFLTNAEQALDFRSLLSNKLLTGENKLTPSQRLDMKSPLNWAQTNANLKRSTGMDLADFNTKYLGRKLTPEEFAKRQKEDRDYWADQAAKAAEYELSPYDKKLPSTDRQRIQKEKMRWDVANSLGDFETRKTAHKMAETIRARYGYSGGAAGDQKIAAEITWQDAAALNAMNAEGQGKYRMAKLELEQAVKEGNEDRIGAAEEKLSQILANPNYRSGAKPGTQNVTGHDVPRADTSDNWMDQAAETLKAVGYGVPGSLAFLAETQGQAIDDRVVEENYDYIRSKAAELPTLQARLSLLQRGEGSESWGTEEQLQKQIAIAQNMQDMLDSYGQMDQNSLGSQLMAKSHEHAAAAMEGTSGLDRLLTQTAISMGQNLPGIAANFIPVVGPAIGLGLMGAQAAGSRSYELTQQGVSPSEALSRGLVSGGIEALTEKIPLESLTKIIKGTTGASFVKNLLKQMGIEATEESASYTANYLADKIAKDPNAEWSTQELLENAAAGALSGGFFAAGGQAIGSALNRKAVTEAAAPAPQQTQTDMEAQAREQALEMLAETAPGREIVPKTEPTTQQAAESPVQTLREAAATSPASAVNTQQEQASKAQAPSAAAKASPSAKTIKLRRVSGQTQTASTRQTAYPKAQGALQQAQTALLTQMSKTLGTSGEKAMLAAWDNSGDPGQYSAGFVRVYNQALSGTTAGKIQAPASLNDAQVMAAYSAGQNDRKLSLEQAMEAAQQAEVAKKNASLYASEEGTEAGLVYDSYVQESMDPDTAASLSSVAKQLGLRVQMVDSVAGGMANADIQGSAVQIEKNNPNPVRALFGHELTHRVQQLAPESYRAFRDYVMQSGNAQADVQRKIAEYKRSGVKLTTEEAMDEIAADYAGEMIEDQDLLKKFIQKNKENKNVLRRFLEAVKQLASKLTGKYQKQAKDAVALLEKAVGDASRQAGKLQASKNTAGKGKTKYSVKEADSSELRKLEAVEIDPYEISTINDITDRKKFDYLVSDFEKSGWEGRPVVIVENGNDGYKALTGSHRILAAKEANIMVKAVVVEYSSDIDDLVSANSDEERASVAKDLYRDGVLSDAAYQLIIREDDLNFENFDVPYADQKRFSLKGSDDYNLRKLQAENEMLRERVDYWKGQTKRTEQVTTDKKAVARAARELIRQYGADMDAADIQGDLQILYDGMASGELSYSAAREQAEGIAEKLISNAVEKDDELYQQYSDLRQFLKDTKLTVSEADSRGITDYADFRRRNLSHFKLSKGQRTNVDLVYKEMSERWPEFFDEDREGTVSDQLYQIEAVLDKVYKITKYNPFDMYTRQAVSGAANEILEKFFDLPQTKKTFADRQAARLDREKAAGKRRLQEERERKNAKLEELRQKNRERVDKAIQKERERREKDLGRLKDQYQARDAAGRTRRKEKELRAKILRHANALSTKLLRPSDKQHIPESLRSAVANVLNSINLESSYAYDPDTLHEVIRKDGKSGGLTGKHVQAGQGTPTKRTQAFQELRLAYENILSESDQQIVVDPDLLANISEIESMKDTPLGALNLSQLTTVWNTLKSVEASISTANKLFGASKFETIQEVAEGLKADNGGKRDRGDYRGPIGAMDKLINAGMLTPESYFHRLGKTGEELFRMLRQAQDKHITIMQEAQEYTAGVIGKTNVRKLEKEVHHFELDGKAVDMTTGQIMSLYELTKRQQAQEHIMVGGIRVDAINKGIKRASMSDAVRVTPEQVSEIVSALTEEQIAIADGLQKFMGGRLAQLGNEASMEVYGYEKFKEKNYFPIKVDSNQTITDQAKDAAAATISGRGFTKGTKPHANNAVMIRDIFDVYADHVTDMATYSAWLGAMENLQRVFNFKFRDADGNVTGTVKGIIHRIFGNNGQAYWKKLTEDLNNGVHGSNDNPFQSFIGNYKTSAVGANIRVFIQQPTSILRALDTISPGDFAAGLVKANPGTWRKVKKYAPIAVWKDWGYFDADTGRQMKSVLFGDDKKLAKVNNALIAPAGAMDSLAWSHIWNALEVETGRKHKELAKGSDAFYRKVAERFNEVIDHSQVVDGVLQRSQLMRSADGVTKMATSFMAEPTKIFNMFTTAAYDLRKSQDHTVRRQARKTMAKTTVALLISFVANAAAQSLVDALRDDDKDEGYWEKFFQAFTGLDGDEESKTDSIKSVAFGNMGSALNPFAYLPFVKDVVSLVEGYDVNRMDMESISNIVQAAGECIKSFSGDGKMTKKNALLGLFGEASRLLGVPAANLKRDVVAAINTWLNGTHNYKLQYEVAKFMYRIENKNNKNMFLDIAYMAWRDGDEDTFLAISQDLMDAFGEDVNGETIERAMRKRMEDQMEKDADFQADQTLADLVGVLPAFEEEDEEEEAEFSAKNLNAKQYEEYSTKRAESYRKYENAVTSNPVWATLDDEAKDKVISAMWKYAGQTALEEASGGNFTITDSSVLKARAAAESGVDVGTFFIMKGVADAQEGVKTVDGVTISDSASYNKLKALRDSGLMDSLSEDQKAAVYDALGVSAKVGSMNEDAMDKLGASIEEEKNAPSVYSVLGEDKTEFVQEFYETCSGLSTSYDGNGKAIKGQRRQDKIIAEINKYSNLTRTEKSALYHMFYESDKNNPWA